MSRTAKHVVFADDGKSLLCQRCGEKKATTYDESFEALDALAILRAWCERHRDCPAPTAVGAKP